MPCAAACGSTTVLYPSLESWWEVWGAPGPKLVWVQALEMFPRKVKRQLWALGREVGSCSLTLHL